MFLCGKEILDEIDDSLGRTDRPPFRQEIHGQLTYLLAQQFIDGTALLAEIAREAGPEEAAEAENGLKSSGRIFYLPAMLETEKGETVLKEKESDVPEVFDCFGTTSSAKDEIKSLFGKREYFSTPKPLKLMKELIRATTSGDSLILDFFAGSGTTGHACFELNAEDGGSRKFILVSNKESDICETVTDKRLQIASDRFNEKYVFMK